MKRIRSLALLFLPACLLLACSAATSDSGGTTGAGGSGGTGNGTGTGGTTAMGFGGSRGTGTGGSSGSPGCSGGCSDFAGGPFGPDGTSTVPSGAAQAFGGTAGEQRRPLPVGAAGRDDAAEQLAAPAIQLDVDRHRRPLRAARDGPEPDAGSGRLHGQDQLDDAEGDVAGAGRSHPERADHRDHSVGARRVGGDGQHRRVHGRPCRRQRQPGLLVPDRSHQRRPRRVRPDDAERVRCRG